MNDTRAAPLVSRKHPAHPPPVEKMHGPVVVLVTVCTRSRRPVLAREGAMTAMKNAWGEARSWRVGRFVIMPDHVHFFCTPAQRPLEGVKPWVAFWKRRLSCLLPDLKGVWQSDCWDTQMRSYDHYLEKVAYVRRNPVRKGLASAEDSWPFQGEMNVIEWR